MAKPATLFAVAAQLMRRIMVDHARQRHALKRGGAAQKVTLRSFGASVSERHKLR
jgi:RNA polymerase sigma-70 factor, ECF subfamily